MARIRWITHACTIAAGKTAFTLSGKPFSPSQTTKNTSMTPWFFRSASTLIQNFADSLDTAAAFASPQAEHVPVAAQVDPDRGVERLVTDPGAKLRSGARVWNRP